MDDLLVPPPISSIGEAGLGLETSNSETLERRYESVQVLEFHAPWKPRSMLRLPLLTYDMSESAVNGSITLLIEALEPGLVNGDLPIPSKSILSNILLKELK